MIAERLLADRPTVTGIIQRLLQKEWILIKHNPKDKRSHLIFLTDETKTLIQEIENVSDEVIKNATASIPKEEVENTVRVFAKYDSKFTKKKRVIKMILVTGAGNVGKEVVKCLIKRNATFKVTTRSRN